MTTKIGLGISTKFDSFGGGREAAKNALYQLNNQDPNILIVFISTIFDQQKAIKGISSVTKEVPLLGCSTIASITSLGGASRNSITVCAISSNSLSFSYGASYYASKNPRLAGNQAARQSSRLKNIKKQIYAMFSDSLSGNGADILRGAQEVLGTSFPIIGGGAIDDLRFQKTYQYLGDAYTDTVVGLLISGDINIGVASAHGWQPIGRPHKITKAKSNIIKEIDRRKPSELYEKYLNKASDELKKEGIANLGLSYPLGASIKERDYIVRSPLKIDPKGDLILSAEFPGREEVSLMIGDKNLALEAAKKACVEAVKNVKKSKIRFSLIFSDIARLKLLRKDLHSEAAIIRDILGKDVPFFGCYTYGEYAPIDTENYKGQSYFHNQAISIAVFSE